MNNVCRILAIAVICVSSVCSEPSWDTLRVTWGVNILSPGVFSKMPSTEQQAQKEGYERLSGDCTEGKFLGVRYVIGQNVGAVLIYDVNGYIAGIQNGIPKKYVDNVNFTSFSFDKTSTYQLDNVLNEDVYFQTVYFIDPSKICNGGRTDQEFKDQGTGTDVYLQNSADPLHSLKVPRYEKDAVGTPWVKGGCFRTMGVHYWYNIGEDMSCADFIPFTPIYNRGKLTVFAFVTFGKYDFSKRFEHPPPSASKMFMPTPGPKCMYYEYNSAGGMTSMHVYFSVRPWNIMC